MGLPGSLPAWAQSAFNNPQHKLLGEIKATHSWGGLSAGRELLPHMHTPLLWTSVPSLRGSALCSVLRGFRRDGSAGGRFGLCLLRLPSPLPAEAVRSRSCAQTLGQWPSRPLAVSQTLTSCRRTSQPQPREHPAHASHPPSHPTAARGGRPRDAAPREHLPRAARDPPRPGTPLHPWGQQVPAAAPCPPVPRRCGGPLGSQWGGGAGEASCRSFAARLHSLPTFGSASHLVFKLQQDTAQAQQTSRSSGADFKQKRCLRNLQSHICSEQKHPPARNTAFQILPLISGSSNNLLPIQLLVLQLTSQY